MVGVTIKMRKILHFLKCLPGILMILVGLMIVDPFWQQVMITFPIVYWIKRYLLLIHSFRPLSLIVWLGFVYVDWKLAAISWISYIVSIVISTCMEKDMPRVRPVTNRPNKKKEPSLSRPFAGLRYQILKDDD